MNYTWSYNLFIQDNYNTQRGALNPYRGQKIFKKLMIGIGREAESFHEQFSTTVISCQNHLF